MERRATTTEVNTRNSVTPLVTLARIIMFAVAVVVVLLAIRFLFILFGANSANGFVNFIYSITFPLAQPFFGIFGYKVHYGVSRVEVASIVAIVVYGIAGYLLARLITINRPQTTV